MSTEGGKKSPEEVVGGVAGSGVEGGVGGRRLPRLFEEMVEADSSTATDLEAGAVGGSEGAGVEGGAPREEVRDSLVESIGEVGREEGLAGAGRVAEDEGEGDDHADGGGGV